VEGWSICPRCGGNLSRGHNRLRCEQCGEVIYENALLAAVALVCTSEGLLLVRRAVEPSRGMWGLPGGFVEADESPEQAVLRELAEETGLQGRVLRLVGASSQFSRFYGRQVVILGYEVEADGVAQAGDDALEVAFFPPEQLPPLAFPAHQELVQAFLG